MNPGEPGEVGALERAGSSDPGRGHLAGHRASCSASLPRRAASASASGTSRWRARTEVSFPALVTAPCASWSPRGSPART
ncbi:MAG: hypothetical protein M3408_06260, partial [Actinomycetota bacterium]|nr:hypothetical protein [Actinomycetota bacterium]